MVSPFGTQLREKLILLGMAVPEQVIGCSLMEIEELKLRQGVKHLPACYRGFLNVMGRMAGKWLGGTDAFYPEILELKDWAKELLAENESRIQLPDDAFVFLMHQGYQFMYFLTGDCNEDPSVYYYTEILKDRPEMPQLRFSHLTEFLTDFLQVVRGKEYQDRFLAEKNTTPDPTASPPTNTRTSRSGSTPR